MNKKIFRLAFPNVVSNITIPLLGMADMALMGHSGQSVNIGAVALGGVLFSYLYWGFSFLRPGTVGLTSQAHGENNKRLITNTLLRGCILAFSAGLLLIIFQNPIERISFGLLEGNETVENLAKGYFQVRIYAAPATIASYVLAGWFLGMQNAVAPLIIALCSNVLNIAFNFLFVRYFDMGVNGVALGTVIAQYIGLVVGVVIMFVKYSEYIKSIVPKELVLISEVKKFVTVNRDIFIRTLCVITVLAFIQSKSAAIDDNSLAISSILIQMMLFFSFFIDGVAHAAEALTGKYIGQRNKELLRSAVVNSVKWGALVGCAFVILFWGFHGVVVSVLTNIVEIKEMFSEYLIWIVLIPLASFLTFILDGVYIGATATRAMLVIMFISTFAVFFPTFLLYPDDNILHGLWLGFVLFLASRSILQALYLKRIMVIPSS